MDERMRADLIVDIARLGDPVLLRAFAHDMIMNAKSEERDRIMAIVAGEAALYSYKEQMIRPSIVAAVFVDAVRAKVESNQDHQSVEK
jgi:hypothetical protein